MTPEIEKIVRFVREANRTPLSESLWFHDEPKKLYLRETYSYKDVSGKRPEDPLETYPVCPTCACRVGEANRDFVSGTPCSPVHALAFELRVRRRATLNMLRSSIRAAKISAQEGLDGDSI